MKQIFDYNKWVIEHWKKGYGQGRYEKYRSWLGQTSFSSIGHTSIADGILIKRPYILFSDLERCALRILEFRDKTIDILDQVPLIDRDITNLIAHELRVRHPKFPGTDINLVMTTDFLAFYDNGNEERKVCYTVKESSELEKRRVIEKLAIEREYWRRQGISEYRILTEKDISKPMARNIESLMAYGELEDIPNLENYAQKERVELASGLEEGIKKWTGSPRELARHFEKQYALLPGTGISLLKYLLFNKRVKTDLSKPISFDRKWELL